MGVLRLKAFKLVAPKISSRGHRPYWDDDELADSSELKAKLMASVAEIAALEPEVEGSQQVLADVEADENKSKNLKQRNQSEKATEQVIQMASRPRRLSSVIGLKTQSQGGQPTSKEAAMALAKDC